jgi:3-deoxy-manno-octulosonate cytidylyltransferase (CMP-KDO synthetase)
VTRVLLVIPARLASTRLPRKMLLRETGKYLVQHAYERALLVSNADEVVVAADDPEIVKAVESFGGAVMLTSPLHPSGSDRVAEVARARPSSLVVNLQGDEPEIDPSDVARLIDAMREGDEMGTLVHERLTEEDQRNTAVVKAVVEGEWAVDFRREPTPGGFRHVGIYAYRPDFLERFTRLPPTAREKERRLEQMRALDHGVRIRAARARHPGAGIDTPADYAAFVRRYHGAG